MVDEDVEVSLRNKPVCVNDGNRLNVMCRRQLSVVVVVKA